MGDRGFFFSGRMVSLISLAFAFVIAIFALFYADWYSSHNITGFASENLNCEDLCDQYPDYRSCALRELRTDCQQCFDINTGLCNIRAIRTPPSEPNVAQPTQEVIIDSYENVQYVSYSTDYALDLAKDYLVVKDYSHAVASGIDEDSEPSQSSGSSNAPVEPSIFVNPCLTESTSLTCRSQLTKIKSFLTNSINDALVKYDSALSYEKEYSSNSQLGNDRQVIEDNIVIMQDILMNVDIQLTKTTEQIQDRQDRIAEDILLDEKYIEDSKKNLDEYIDKYEDKIPESPDVSVIVDAPSTGGGSLSEDCTTPIDSVILDDVITGEVGVSKKTGKACNLDLPYVKPVPGNGVSSTIISSGGPPVAINPGPQMSGGGNSIAFYLRNDDILTPGETRESFVAALSPSGNFILGFFSAENNYDLEKKMDAFVQRVVLGIGGQSLEGTSSQSEFYDSSTRKTIPWVLWIFLFALLIQYLFFGYYTLPAHERLIYFGKKSLVKKDFINSVRYYNELLNSFDTLSHDLKNEARQEILAYFILIKSALKDYGIKFDIDFSKSRLPYFAFHDGSIKGISFSDHLRVEKLLHDSLRDMHKYPKQIAKRAPLIAKMYSGLDDKSREKLAPLYERFIYQLRDI